MPVRSREIRRGRAWLSIIVSVGLLLAVVGPTGPAIAQGTQGTGDVHRVPVPERGNQTVAPTSGETDQPRRGRIDLAAMGPLADPAEAGAVFVKFVEGSGVEVRDGRLVGLAGFTGAMLSAAIAGADAQVEPLFSRTTADLRRDRLAFESKTGTAQTDLTKWVRITLGDQVRSGALFAILNSLDVVEVALPEPVLSSAAYSPALPVSANYEPDQLYLGPAPLGIDADYAATIAGGDGANVGVTDVEFSWNTAHEDLTGAVAAELINGTPFDPFGDNDHGTAVVGILGADDNGFGVTGVTPGARLQLVNVYTSGGPALANAIDLAAANSDPGDVILIEQQLCPVALVSGRCVPGWLPVEWYGPYYDAVVAAVARGIIVVEAAGNGGRDVDSVLALPDSGAIMVGAGNPSEECNVLGNEPARGRLFFSNYGKRLDLQAHGACVWTAGSEGAAVNPGAPTNARYTASFSGTSSAAAIVAGAAASMSSVAIGAGDPLDPREVRALLRSTGSPQNKSLDPLPIGPLPNLRAAIEEYVKVTLPAPVNDDFFSPTALPEIPTTIIQETDGATVQVGEPVSSCGYTDSTVWFTTTPTRDVVVTLTLQASAGNPSLAAWRFADSNTLEQIDCSSAGSDAALTALQIPMQAGETYRFQVGATSGREITVTLVGAAGCDFNGDGFGDALIGSPGESVKKASRAGAINVFYGHPRGQPDSVPLFTQASPGVGGRAEAGDRFGSSLACGDIDGDGYDDAVVGVPGESGRGKKRSGSIHVFYGSASGLDARRDRIVSQSSGAVPGRPETGDMFGSAVAVGDVNGDGFGDVVVGAPGEGLAGQSGAGMVVVLFGSAVGLDPSRGLAIHQNRPGVRGRAEAKDRLGTSLAVGDTDGDGFDDIFIGISGEGLGGLQRVGAVMGVPGSALGPVLAQATWIAPTQARVASTARENGRFGAALALGDLDGDGHLDLVVSSPGHGGVVDVLAGSASGIGRTRGVLIQQGITGVSGVSELGDRFGAALSVLGTDVGGGVLYVGASGEDLERAANTGVFVEVAVDRSFGVTRSSQRSQDSAGVAGAAEKADALGAALAGEDLDGDGYPDLMVSAPSERLKRRRAAGMVLLVPGSAVGLDFAADRVLHQGSPGVAGRVERGDSFGSALS